MDRNYEDFAQAIIVRAAKDYRKALKRLKRVPRDKEARHTKTEIERFFSSNWFSILTLLDGKLIIQALQQEVII